MRQLLSDYDIRIISPDREQCFFGYYDLRAYDATDQYHLCNRAGFIDRIPGSSDRLALGYIRLETGEFTQFADTTLWNFQQGCLLQWFGNSGDEVCYNVRTPRGGSTCIHHLKTGEKRRTDRPCACVSPDGKWGLAVDFGRIFDFRAGYGYCGLPDKNAAVNRPDGDGIFLVNLLTGRSKLIISYADCFRQFPIKGMENAKFVINHITFNPSSNRFLFLLRNFPTEGSPWFTTLITSDLDGHMHPLLKNTYVSHYHWKNDKQIVAHCAPKNKKGLYLLDDMSNAHTELYSPHFTEDIHCIYSPDRKYIIGDAYPIHDRYRTLYIYNPETEKTQTLLKAYSTQDDNLEVRCDLHARWNSKGTKISFDSTHRGKRDVCEIDVTGISL